MTFEINNDAMLVRAPAGAAVAGIEAHLNASGLTLGAFHPPVGSDPAFTVADWLKDPLIPPCNWRGGTLLERIVSVAAEGKAGRLVTNMAPRSATGPDLNYLVCSTGGALARIEHLWLRVSPRPAAAEAVGYRFGSLHDAIMALGALAQRKAHFPSMVFASRESGLDHTAVVTNDTGSDLGKARARHVDEILLAHHATRGPGRTFERAGSPATVEVYAPYAHAKAIVETAEVLEEAGAVLGCLYRYGPEGMSIRYEFEGTGPVPDETFWNAERTAVRHGGMIVSGDGAFLTNGADPVVERIFKRAKENLS